MQQINKWRSLFFEISPPKLIRTHCPESALSRVEYEYENCNTNKEQNTLTVVVDDDTTRGQASISTGINVLDQSKNVLDQSI
jgi:hypothetical protein